MKKIALLFLGVIFAIGLAACNNVPDDVVDCVANPDGEGCPTICPEGEEFDGTACVPIDPDPVTCETGYHLEGENCVPDTVTCEEGFHEEQGECVPDEDTRTPEEIVVDFIVDNYNTSGDVTFLSTAIGSMDFTTAQTMTTDVYFEFEEYDSDIKYIDGQFVDKLLVDEVNGDKMQRTISLDVNGEMTISFTVIYVEVPTGVHVYIEPQEIISAVFAGNPQGEQILYWIGFDDPWAVFKFDDSLEAVIQVEVLKDMLVSLFFSEMGETFFDDVQAQLEMQIGFDLNQYGLELGQIMDAIIEEDFALAETLINQIDYMSIQAHADAMYVAPNVYEFLMGYEAELLAAGFNTSLLTKLQVSTWNEGTGMYDVTLPIDPLEKGTYRFFEALTPTDWDALIEEVIKPNVEMLAYQGLNNEVNPEWLENDFLSILQSHEQFLIENWPEGSTFDPTTEYALLASLGAYDYWWQLTEEQQGVIYWAVDMNQSGWTVWTLHEAMEYEWDFEWRIIQHEEAVDVWYLQGNMIDMFNNNAQYFTDNYSIDVTEWINQIENDGIIQWFYWGVWEEDIPRIVEVSNLPGNEGYVEIVEQLLHIRANEWKYQEYYRIHDRYVHKHGISWDLENILYDNYDYFWNAGVDVENTVEAIHNIGGWEWLTTVATQDEINLILGTMEFYDEWDWRYYSVETITMMLENPMDVWEWFGIQEQIHDLYWLRDEVESFLWNNEYYFNDQTSVDVYDMVDRLWNAHDVLEWFGTLSQDELQAVQDAFANDPHSYGAWAVDLIFQTWNPESGIELCFGRWDYCHSMDQYYNDISDLMMKYEQYVLDEYGVDATQFLLDLENYNVVDWFMWQASVEEREMLMDLADMEHWPYEVLWKFQGINEFEQEILWFLTTHETELNALADFDATAMIASIDTNGIQYVMANEVSEATMEILFEAYLYPELVQLHADVTAGELPEWITEFVFGNPHMDILLAEITPTYVIDENIIQANMLMIDYDLFYTELQTFDFQALFDAMYSGQAGYDTYVAGLTETNVAYFLEIFSPGILSLEPYWAYYDDMNYAINSLTLFSEFVDPMYYMEDVMDVNVSKTPELYVRTDMQMDGIGYARVFSDFTDQLGIYLAGFETLPFPYDENWVCLSMECEEPDFAEVIAFLSGFGSSDMYMLYDPNDITWMEMGMDMTSLMNGLAEEQTQWLYDDEEPTDGWHANDMVGVNAMEVTVLFENGADIPLPAAADTTDVNAVMEDVAKFAIASEAYQILRDYAEYYEMDPTMLIDLYNNPVYLRDIEFMDFSMAFDRDMSYITVTVDLVMGIPDPTTLDYQVMLYWVDGTEVFDAPMGLQELIPLWLDGDIVSQAAYYQLVDSVNDTNWSVMKLFLYYLWEPEEYYEEDNY